MRAQLDPLHYLVGHLPNAARMPRAARSERRNRAEAPNLFPIRTDPIEPSSTRRTSLAAPSHSDKVFSQTWPKDLKGPESASSLSNFPR